MSNRFITLLLMVTMVALIVHSCDRVPYPRGKEIYKQYCSNCHMDEGKGFGEIYPSLIESPYLTTEIEALPCLIRHGKKSTVLSTVYMPAHDQLSAIDISNLINYMSDSFTKEPKQANPKDINQYLSSCP